MADVQPGLNRMGSPRPREIIYPLIPILKRALRTAECRPVIEVRPGQTRSIRFCRSLAEEPVPEEPRLVDGIRGHRRRSLGRSQGPWYRLANVVIADEPEGLVLDVRPGGCESALILMEWGSA